MLDTELPSDGSSEVSWPPDDEKIGSALSILQEVFGGLGVALLVWPFGDGERDVKLLSNSDPDSLRRILEALLETLISGQ